MKLIYTTLNNNEEARALGKLLLERKMANCVNYFPITCIYNYKQQITEEPEVVMIIKTQDGKYDEIQSVIKQVIEYDNFIGQLDVEKVNGNFENWLKEIVGE